MIKVKNSLIEDEKNTQKSNKAFTLFVLILVLILFLFIILNSFVFGYVVVNGRSMESTLYTDDILIMNKISKFNRGDVVVIGGEKLNGDWLIKRVIAIEGDTVDIKGGKVYLKKSDENDFSLLNEPYLDDFQITKENGCVFPKQIGENEVFYLGDNRLNSKDSRSEFGTCFSSQIIGVVSGKTIKNKNSVKKFCMFFIKLRKFIGISTEVSD